ncbi:uncharacterized protein LOC133200851 [Saccostrea echinata]|uniref:uncharacterized protein LOC133200851 n=1 Tax=Saccostrea echinata TaxID=191078 RepID=UPI002A841828|nr:uncharacterized protein LOC133200851 [Saccostrea echinata]
MYSPSPKDEAHEYSVYRGLLNHCLTGALLCTLVLTLIHETVRAFISLTEKINDDRYTLEGSSYSVTFQHCLMAFLHVFRVYVCCLLVMSLMTYNVWIFLTIGLGSGVGYLLIRSLILHLLNKRRKRSFNTCQIPTTFSKFQPLCSTPNRNIETSMLAASHLTLSHDFMAALRERRSSKNVLSGTLGSADLALQWDYTDNMAEDLEPNNWIRQSNWDGSLEMLDAGYVGGDSLEHSVSFAMYVSVV